MGKATTPGGQLQFISNCYIEIPNGDGLNSTGDNTFGTLRFDLNNLPDISDSKSVHYNPEGIIGRSTPLVTYSYSDTRNISIQFHLFILDHSDISRNFNFMRAIQSASYTRKDNNQKFPYLPPVVCKFQCGNLLADEPLCLILQQYSLKFPTEVAWAELSKEGAADNSNPSLLPYKFDIDTTWWVVYTSDDLPDSSRIVKSGR